MSIFNASSPYIIAEIGGNHEGNFEEAKRLSLLAINAGANAVKFQVYTGDSLVNRAIDPQRAAHFDGFSLTAIEYLELAKFCEKMGGVFAASIWDEKQLDDLDPFMPFYKIGSGDLTNFQLLRLIAAKGKPIVLSTGLSTYEEIDRTIDFILKCNSFYECEDSLVITQCTSAYPTPSDEANLSVILEMRSRYKYYVGYSDHTLGTRACEIACAFGVNVIEVHFTDCREGKTFRDHFISFTPDELSELRENSDNIVSLIGSREKEPTMTELSSSNIDSFRRALYPVRDLRAGEVVNASDFVSLRPAKGVAADKIEFLEGKKVVRDLARLSVLSISDFE